MVCVWGGGGGKQDSAQFEMSFLLVIGFRKPLGRSTLPPALLQTWCEKFTFCYGYIIYKIMSHFLPVLHSWVTLPKTGQWCDRSGGGGETFHFIRKSVQNVENDV